MTDYELTVLATKACGFNKFEGHAEQFVESGFWRKLGYSHVTMSVEDPNHVGKMGVADIDFEYTWKKRRD